MNTQCIISSSTINRHFFFRHPFPSRALFFRQIYRHPSDLPDHQSDVWSVWNASVLFCFHSVRHMTRIVDVELPTLPKAKQI